MTPPGIRAQTVASPPENTAANTVELTAIAQPVELIARDTNLFGLTDPERPVTELVQSRSGSIDAHLLQILH
jgi:hypothetical protein